MAANGISTLTYKQQRQAAKLALAATDRAASNRRYVLDSTQLPTLYATSDNDTSDVVNNANTGGLVIGRPWVDIGQADAYLLAENSDNIITEGSDTLITE